MTPQKNKPVIHVFTNAKYRKYFATAKMGPAAAAVAGWDVGQAHSKCKCNKWFTLRERTQRTNTTKTMRLCGERQHGLVLLQLSTCMLCVFLCVCVFVCTYREQRTIYADVFVCKYLHTT